MAQCKTILSIECVVEGVKPGLATIAKHGQPPDLLHSTHTMQTTALCAPQVPCKPALPHTRCRVRRHKGGCEKGPTDQNNMVTPVIALGCPESGNHEGKKQ